MDRQYARTSVRHNLIGTCVPWGQRLGREKKRLPLNQPDSINDKTR